MNFTALIQTIQQTHTALQQQAAKAINRALTLRNWLIGYYIVEFEQRGEDRATYGEKLLSQLANELKSKGISNVHERELRRYRAFYLVYPQLAEAFAGAELPQPIRGTAFPELETKIRQTLSPEFRSDENQAITHVPPEKLINRLSFSHFAELLEIADPLKRTFYETECIKGVWSVRELRRQINTLFYERCGLSQDPKKLSALTAQKAEIIQPSDIIKSVYTFEFLGLQAKDIVEEKELETALLDHLQQFMLELGHGFCFEARQQKILIGGDYFYIDLVFYHRILKCHVLVELKVDAFSHANAGQLNTYLAYYKKEVAQPDDNPPVGILLVTDKNKALVEYATAGMDNKLFVSQYLVQLPSKEQLQQFVQNELRQLS